MHYQIRNNFSCIFYPYELIYSLHKLNFVFCRKMIVRMRKTRAKRRAMALVNLRLSWEPHRRHSLAGSGPKNSRGSGLNPFTRTPSVTRTIYLIPCGSALPTASRYHVSFKHQNEMSYSFIRMYISVKM